MTSLVEVKRGDVVRVTLPFSEVCCHLGVAGDTALVEITRGEHPAAQILRDWVCFSFPITLGEAGFTTRDGRIFAEADSEVVA